MITGGFVELACNDRSCAPPPVGTGGSKSSSGSSDSVIGAYNKSRQRLEDLSREDYTGSPDQKERLRSQGALDDYVGTSYISINQRLRTVPERLWSESQRRQIKALDNAFEHFGADIDQPGVVYRGMAVSNERLGIREGDKYSNPVVEALDRLKPGTVITDKGFMSTSWSEDAADEFIRNGEDVGVMLTIRLPRGTRVLAGDSTEHEALLQRGTRLRVVSAKSRGIKDPLVIDVEAELVLE
jgi:hypothetical protein